jgi:hypothetical protein
MNVFRLGAIVLSLWSAATIHGAARIMRRLNCSERAKIR